MSFVDWLDRIPLGSIIAFGGVIVTVIGAVGALVALINGTISYAEFVTAISASTAAGGVAGWGGGKIGEARNQAGKGGFVDPFMADGSLAPLPPDEPQA